MKSSNPFLTIWLRPRVTTRRIISRNRDLYTSTIAGFIGIDQALGRASQQSLGDSYSSVEIIILACVFGPPVGIVSLWIFSYLTRWTGRWIGGTAEAQDLRTAFAWSRIPALCGVILWIPLLLVWGPEMFTSEPNSATAETASLPLLSGILLFKGALGIWSLILLCHTVAEVQSYRSAWKGLANLLLAGIVLAPAILLMAILIKP